MELRELKTFVTAAECMNFSRAAEKLGYTQSSVTLQIQHLEKELSVKLFERIGKRIYLTDKGSLLLKRSQGLIREMESLSLDLQEDNGQSETIRIGLSESLLSYGFSDIIHQFQQKYPHVKLLLKTGIRDLLSRQMLQGELDFAFIIDQNVMDLDWDGKIITSVNAHFVASPSHPLFQKRGLSVRDLLDQRLVMTEHNYGYTLALLQILAKEGIELPIHLETGNTDLILSLLQKEPCISFLPEYVIREDLKTRHLALLPLPQYSVTAYLQIYYHKNKYLTPAMSTLIRMISEATLSNLNTP